MPIEKVIELAKENKLSDEEIELIFMQMMMF